MQALAELFQPPRVAPGAGAAAAAKRAAQADACVALMEEVEALQAEVAMRQVRPAAPSPPRYAGLPVHHALEAGAALQALMAFQRSVLRSA